MAARSVGETIAGPGPRGTAPARPPRGGGVIGEGGEERRVDHRGAEPLEHGTRDPRVEARYQHGQPDPPGPDDHPPGDQALAADAVRERPGHDLEQAPDGRVDRLDEADPPDAEAVGRA